MYQEFFKKLGVFSVITNKEIAKVFPYFDTKNLVNWQKKKYIEKLRNNHYIFNDYPITEETLYHIANKLYEPSYISLESALSFYSVIPEGVYTFQSVSTRKTNKFETPVGAFQYHNLKKELYFGYKIVENEGVNYRISDIEKSILDFLYLRASVKKISDFESLRWNKEILKSIDFVKIDAYLTLFKSKTLEKKIKNLKNYIDA